MEINSITFNTSENKIIVELTDGSTKEYTDKNSYLIDYPDRKLDVVTMGW